MMSAKAARIVSASALLSMGVTVGWLRYPAGATMALLTKVPPTSRAMVYTLATSTPIRLHKSLDHLDWLIASIDQAITTGRRRNDKGFGIAEALAQAVGG